MCPSRRRRWVRRSPNAFGSWVQICEGRRVLLLRLPAFATAWFFSAGKPDFRVHRFSRPSMHISPKVPPRFLIQSVFNHSRYSLMFFLSLHSKSLILSSDIGDDWNGILASTAITPLRTYGRLLMSAWALRIAIWLLFANMRAPAGAGCLPTRLASPALRRLSPWKSSAAIAESLSGPTTFLAPLNIYLTVTRLVNVYIWLCFEDLIYLVISSHESAPSSWASWV